MAQTHIDFLNKLRTKLVEQRRTMAIRQSNPSSVESVDNMTKLQEAIEAIDRAILDEQRMPETP
jgi:hypothetical protein